MIPKAFEKNKKEDWAGSTVANFFKAKKIRLVVSSKPILKLTVRQLLS